MKRGKQRYRCRTCGVRGLPENFAGAVARRTPSAVVDGDFYDDPPNLPGTAPTPVAQEPQDCPRVAPAVAVGGLFANCAAQLGIVWPGALTAEETRTLARAAAMAIVAYRHVAVGV